MKDNALEIYNDKNKLLYSNKSYKKISFNSLPNSSKIILNKNSNSNLTLKGIKKNNNIDIILNENSLFELNLINSKNDNNCNITVTIKDNSIFKFNFADFYNNNSNFILNINLEGNQSKTEFNFSSIINNFTSKKYLINFNHINVNTSSIVKGYGIVLKESNFNCDVISTINDKCINSSTNQNVKVILIDEKSKGKVCPIMNIYCDDVIANHSCAIGHINNEHLYYLNTRGISENKAKELITKGYLTPICDKFNKSDKKILLAKIKEIY
ncbi:MAG: SufD family Fe-S cluster assembly protein [Bacillales bacterium]